MLRRRDACMGIMGIVRFMREVWVRHGIPRGFAVLQCGLARAMSYRWGNAGQLGGGGVRGAWA